MIIYLHGFASSGNSNKARRFRELLPGIDLFAPDYPAHKIDEALPFLRAYLQDLVDGSRYPEGMTYLLVGSSLGGFYAKLLAREFDFMSIAMINPALSPSRTLKSRVGRNVNYQTGEAFELTEEDVAAFTPYEALDVPPATQLTVLLEEGDEVIPYREAYEAYRDVADVFVYPGGSHAFDRLEEAARVLRQAHPVISL